MYTELHARSVFSFLEGASIPEELASVCVERGMTAMAVLDRDGVYGAPRFYQAAKKIACKRTSARKLRRPPDGVMRYSWNPAKAIRIYAARSRG